MTGPASASDSTLTGGAAGAAGEGGYKDVHNPGVPHATLETIAQRMYHRPYDHLEADEKMLVGSGLAEKHPISTEGSSEAEHRHAEKGIDSVAMPHIQ